MAWTDSRIFASFVTDSFNSTASFNVDADTIKSALFNNSVTPDRSATSANSRYNGGTWTTTNEVTDASGWAAGGRALSSVTSSFTSGVYTFDAADLSSATSTTTLSGVYGTLVYNDTLSSPQVDQALSFNYFGGSQSVTSGTFTIVWNASGIFTVTV